ncbi:ATP synthase subunit I [Sphingomonas sp. PAMC 26605]|uniref:ATP synthase subunit I n=1 Tax=Sphingomonas sp. PAMC 26605 TaxID=1112214 RepID=UPI00026CD238|nr:ATP synthase subunit I [Sphingomonas sp. PAMC 26605]
MMQGLVLAFWLVVGILAGIVYFMSIWWSAQRFTHEGGLTTTLAVALLRLATLGGLLVFASFQGAGPLLAMALGVVLARFGVMRRFRAVAS